MTVMPNHFLPKFTRKIEDIEKSIVELRTDAKWLKWIIMGAAGLGFIEKLIGWVFK